MSTSSTPLTPATTPHAPDTQLSERSLRFARVGFLALTATVIALNLVALPDISASHLTPDVLKALHRQDFSPTLYAAIGVGSGVVSLLVYLALSLLIFWRRSEDRIALFCAVMLVTFGGVAASPLDDATSGGPMPQPLASIPVLTATVHLLIVAGQVSVVVFFYLFPSGRFVPRWTRWFALLALAYWLVNVFFPALVPGAQGSLILVFWLVAVVAQIYRYQRVSTPVEREQTKWVAVGFVVAFLIVGVPTALQLVLPAFAESLYSSGSIIAGLIISNTWVVAVLVIPVVITVAILRAHLWDIDVLINRALVYGSLTVILGVTYGVCVVGAQALVGAVTRDAGTQPVVIVATTLLIAALFQPVRVRVQAVVDRRFYRNKYDAQKTLDAFSATLRSEVDLSQLSAHLMQVIEESIQPAHVSLWVRTPGPREAPAERNQ